VSSKVGSGDGTLYLTSATEGYLEQESLDHVKIDVLERHAEQPKQRTRTGHAHTPDVTLKNASFAWSPAHLGFRLSEVSATFSLGLNLICGKIGAGKTLLLRGLLGEASLVEGQVRAM
jgi:ABC-type bacteriocin/lantibiotic exporter with double-glycine peptidase domain